jgi:hypothetical protein
MNFFAGEFHRPLAGGGASGHVFFWRRAVCADAYMESKMAGGKSGGGGGKSGGGGGKGGGGKK